MAGGKGREPIPSLEHIVGKEYSMEGATELERLLRDTETKEADELLRHNRVLCYKTRTWHCGETVEVEAYPIYKRGTPDEARMKERIRSSKAQQKQNDKMAEDMFRRKAETNFGRKDFFLTLTYRGPAPTMEQARRDFRNFIDRVNRRRARKGIPQCKYMAVIEAGNRSGRAHHHVLIDGGLSREEYEEIWGKGFANCDRLQTKDNGLKGVCKYMLKAAGTEARAKDQKRWTCSRNLKDPKVTESTHRVTKRQAAKIAADAEFFGPEVMRKLYPGLQLTEIRAKRSEFLAGAYIFARLCRA